MTASMARAMARAAHRREESEMVPNPTLVAPKPHTALQQWCWQALSCCASGRCRTPSLTDEAVPTSPTPLWASAPKAPWNFE